MNEDNTLELHEQYNVDYTGCIFGDIADEIRKIPERSYKLGCSPKTTKKAFNILDTIQWQMGNDVEFILPSKGNVVTASVQYIASILSNERKKQDEIAEVYETNTAAIRKFYKEISDKCGVELQIG